MEARKICPNAVMASSVSSRQCTSRPHAHLAATPANNPGCHVFSEWRGVLPWNCMDGIWIALSEEINSITARGCVAGDPCTYWQHTEDGNENNVTLNSPTKRHCQPTKISTDGSIETVQNNADKFPHSTCNLNSAGFTNIDLRVRRAG